jgi:hypothetical protein
MAFLFGLIEIILLAIVVLDTLGFLIQNKRKPDDSNPHDYNRLIFTWTFFFVFKALTCCSGSGLISGFFALLGLLAKAYISIPLLGGTQKLYDVLVRDNSFGIAAKKYIHLIKEKLNPEEKHKTG